LLDGDLNFYFFSPSGVRHVEDLDSNPNVGLAVFDREQPDYAGDLNATLNGVQIEAVARRLEPGQYTDDIRAGIEALQPPMPPYEVFKMEPTAFFVPRIEDGVNVRHPIDMG
jgi:hypothetical protein